MTFHVKAATVMPLPRIEVTTSGLTIIADVAQLMDVESVLSWGQLEYGSLQLHGAVVVQLNKVDVPHSIFPFVQGHGSSPRVYLCRSQYQRQNAADDVDRPHVPLLG
jgi:hypothetical protein